MRSFSLWFSGFLCLASSASAQLFTDNFTRGSDPAALGAPWAVQTGAWSVTGGTLQGGLNPLGSYGHAYVSTNWTNFSVQARIQLPTGAYGGGLAGRLDANSGSRYAAWLYPENSPGGSNVLKLIKFQSWQVFGYTNSAYIPMTQVKLASVGTGFHTLRLTFSGNRISVFYDGTQLINMIDEEASFLESGGIALEFWTETAPYTMTSDDVLVTGPAPVAVNDSYTATAGTTLTVPNPGVLANDSGGNGPLRAILVNNVTRGTLNLSTNGGFTYTPNAGYLGSDSFTYRASDGLSNSPSATVSLSVVANRAPTGSPDNYSVLVNGTLQVNAPGVLNNDTDPDGQALTALFATGPANGTLSLSANGTFTYTPSDNFVGTDSFTYRASDGSSNSTPVSVTISVAHAGAWFFDDFTRPTASGLTWPWAVQTGNFSLAEGRLQAGPHATQSYGYAYITNTWTNYAFQARVRFPLGAYGGGLGGRLNSATGSHYGVWVYPETSPVASNVLRLVKFQSYTAFGYNGGQFMQQVNLPAVGTNWHDLKVGFSGKQIAVYYDGVQVLSVADTEAQTHTRGSPTVEMWTLDTPYSVLLDDARVDPLAADDNYAVDESFSLTIANPGVLANDTAVFTTGLTATLVAGPTNGTLSLNSAGGFVYTPDSKYIGQDAFTYRVMDGTTNLGTAVARIVVAEYNYPPVLPTLSDRSVDELDQIVVTNTATDPDSPPQVLQYQLVSPPLGASISSQGVIDWTPTEAQGPGTYTLTTIVTDNGTPPRSATNTVRISVREINEAPNLPQQGDRTLAELTTLRVTNTVIDPDLPANPATYSLVDPPAGAAISAAGVITWTPTEDQGPGVYLVKTIVNDNGTPPFTATNSFAVTVTEVNSAPVLPVQQTRTVAPLTPLVITNTAIDSDLPANGLTYALTGPAGALIDSGGIISWTPGPEFNESTNVFQTVVSDDGSPVARSTNSFSIIVNTRPVLSLESATLAAEVCVPTNNVVDPGEAVTFVFSLKNSGTGSTTNLVVSLLETNGVTSPSAPQTYGTLAAGGGIASQAFSFIATGACGGTFTALLQLQDGAADLGRLSATVQMGQPATVFTQDFDGVTVPALPAGWTTAATGAQAVWRTQNTVRDTLPNAASSASANTVGINELVSPPTLISISQPRLVFRNNYSLESKANTTTGYDGGVLEMSVDGGTFTDILAAGGTFVSGGYTHTIDSGYSNPLAGRQAWSGSSPGWTNTIVSLPVSVLGRTVQFRWRCGTDSGGVSGSGWRIDTMSITGQGCCANSPPILAGRDPVTLPETTLLQVTNAVVSLGTPSNPALYALLDAPEGAVIDSNGIISWTPSEAQGPGTFVLTTVAANSGAPYLRATNSFVVTVTEIVSAPVLPSQTEQTVAEQTLLTVTNTATDPDLPAETLVYTLESPLPGMAIDASGIFTWAPTEAQGPSVNTVTTVVDDGIFRATNTFTVIVTEVNSAPVLPPPSEHTIAELQTLSVTKAATDSDLPAETLTYALENPLPGMAIDGQGVFTWSPTEEQGPATNLVTVIVTDSGTPQLTATNTFTVIVTEVNSAPELPVQADRQVIALDQLVVTNTATDQDLPAQIVSYSLENPIPGMMIDLQGVFTWTPTEEQAPSTNTVVTIATDNGTPPLTATNRFTIVVVRALPLVILPMQVTNNTAVITWQSVVGRSYILQYKTALEDPEWTDILPAQTATAETTTAIQSLEGVTQRFYRVTRSP